MSTEHPDFLHEFLQGVVGFRVPRGPWSKADWSGLSGEDVEKASVAFKSRDMPEILAWETREACRRHREWLESLIDRAGELAQEARSISAETIGRHYDITRVSLTLPPDDSDLLLMKINHGYWEILFMSLHDGYIDDVIRPTARFTLRNSYVASRFTNALAALVNGVVSEGHEGVSFGGTKFGFSFGAGDLWHDDWMKSWSSIGRENQRIARGVHAGLRLFLTPMWNGGKAHFVDGAYAKKGIFDGSVAALMGQTGSAADRIVFCVPPHLAGLHLQTSRALRQQVLHVSGRIVHDVWPATLAGVGNPILAMLAAGEHVAVFAQAAVFSAMLPLYLATAKSSLGLKGRLTYVDLGQALDIMTPDKPGLWAGRVASSKTSGASGVAAAPSLPLEMRP